MSQITSTSIIEKLASFSHQDLPAHFTQDISHCDIEHQDNGVKIVMSLPYAIGHVAPIVAAYLADKFATPVTVEFDCVPAQSPCFNQIGQIVLVASGKGGVGKSTTAVNLAIGLAKCGAKVGLLDADIYGPSIPLMMGMQGQRPVSSDGKIMEPLVGFGIKVNSIGFLVDPNDAAIWRGPMASAALSQLIGQTNWGALDYLVVDMPPGTGDIQLTIAQKFPCTGAVVVTTPQTIALADAQKGVAMFNKVNIPVLGIIENMSYFQCGQCGEIAHIFGQDGAVELAKSLDTELLGQVPLEAQNRENSDKGTPTVVGDGPLAQGYLTIASKLSWQLYQLGLNDDHSGVKITMVD